MAKNNLPESQSVNIIGAGTLIEGDITTNGDMRIDGTLTGSTSGNGPSVHSVNESGNSTYNVASPMIGFINIVINGTSYAVPYY